MFFSWPTFFSGMNCWFPFNSTCSAAALLTTFSLCLYEVLIAIDTDTGIVLLRACACLFLFGAKWVAARPSSCRGRSQWREARFLLPSAGRSCTGTDRQTSFRKSEKTYTLIVIILQVTLYLHAENNVAARKKTWWLLQGRIQKVTLYFDPFYFLQSCQLYLFFSAFTSNFPSSFEKIIWFWFPTQKKIIALS